MFALLAQSVDLCVTKGNCAPTPKLSKDTTSFSAHSSTHGVYTADQIKTFRDCSNDYQSQFVPKYDENKQKILGYVPVDGKGKMEKFRNCWEPLNLAYPASPKYG